MNNQILTTNTNNNIFPQNGTSGQVITTDGNNNLSWKSQADPQSSFFKYIIKFCIMMIEF